MRTAKSPKEHATNLAALCNHLIGKGVKNFTKDQFLGIVDLAQLEGFKPVYKQLLFPFFVNTGILLKVGNNELGHPYYSFRPDRHPICYTEFLTQVEFWQSRSKNYTQSWKAKKIVENKPSMVHLAIPIAVYDAMKLLVSQGHPVNIPFEVLNKYV